MAEAAQKQAENVKPAQRPGQVYIKGRIDSVDQYQGRHRARVMLPAEDEYGMPGAVMVYGQQPLGQQGQEVEFWGKLRGRPRNPRNSQGQPFAAADTWVEVQ